MRSMKNVAKKLETVEATQLSGYVARTEGPWCWVRCGDFEYRARRAASCFLDPQPRDHVLLALLGDKSAFVLAVLERGEEGSAATVSLDGDLSFRLPGGRFDVVAKDGVGLASTGDVSITSAGVAVKAIEGRIGIDRLTMLSQKLLAEVVTVKVVAGAIDSVLDRLTQKVKRAYRSVEELDQLRAKRVDYRAEKSMQLGAESAIVTATEIVKLDGEHIHLG